MEAEFKVQRIPRKVCGGAQYAVGS